MAEAISSTGHSFAHAFRLCFVDAGIRKAGLGHGQRTTRGFEAAACGGNGRGLLLGSGCSLASLALGSRAGLHQLLVSVVIELRELKRGFLLG